MKTRISLGIAVFVASVSTLSAQWPEYEVPGVPRTADGKVDLNAPAPRTPDGKPDFTGIWENLVDDPKAYTKPWTVTITQRIMVDHEMMEFSCNENEKSSKHNVAN